MNIANFLFYVLLFVGFFLPTNSNMYLPLPGVLLKVNEIAFLLLPIINIFCTSNQKKINIGRKLSKYILLYLAIVVITEFVFKPFVFGQSIGDSIKAFRIGLPFFSSMILLYSGINANIKVVWRIILYAISLSILLSILSLYINLPIYYNMEEENILQATQGRIMNSNAPFGIIGLYLLFADKDKWYNQGNLTKYVSILSIIALILSFNRTYLALLVLEFIYLAKKTMSYKSFFKILLYPILFFLLSFTVYKNNDTIQRQIDKRILSIVFEDNSLKEATIENNRDMIYKGVLNRIDEGYWVIGLPYNEPIYINTSVFLKESMPMNITDTSLINVVLRYGFISLLLFSLIYIKILRLSKMHNFLRVTLIIYLIASLNIDSLFRHNSVFFIVIVISLINTIPYGKNSFYSQN